MIFVFIAYLWIICGFVFELYSAKIFNYAMHRKYKLATPVLEYLWKDDVGTIISCLILGPFSILTILMAADYLPKGITIKEAIKAQCGVNHNGK